MRKFALAVICTFVLVGYVMADEFLATISKVDGNSITFKKGGFGGGKKKDGAEPAKDEKADATADVKVAKGTFGGGGFGKGTDKGAGKGTGKGGIAITVGDPIEGGLKNEIFTKIDDQKGVLAQITTNDAGKITQIVTVDFGGAGKKGGGTGKGGFGTGKGAGGKKGKGAGTEKD